MEQTFSFSVTPMDPAVLRPQVRDALEKRNERLSREKYPKLWEATDRLNRVQKVSPAVSARRRRRECVGGVVNWLLGLLLLLPGLMEPSEMVAPLVVGGLGFGLGMGMLFKRKPRLLTMLNLPLGLLLTFGAVANRQELGNFLWLGLVCLVVGIAARLPRRKVRRDPYDEAAGVLLEGKDNDALRVLRVRFDGDGMTVTQAGTEQGVVVPYDRMEMILETEDLLLVVDGETITTLQKKDLCTGVFTDLREALQQRVQYVGL